MPTPDSRKRRGIPAAPILCAGVTVRKNLQESLEFAGEGKVAAHYSMDKLDNINSIFDRMRAGHIDGRIVVSI